MDATSTHTWGMVDRLVRERMYREAVELIDQMTGPGREGVPLLVEKARLILEANDPAMPIREAGACLESALLLDRENTEVLCLLARFYTVVCPDLRKTQEYESSFSGLIRKKRILRHVI